MVHYIDKHDDFNDSSYLFTESIKDVLFYEDLKISNFE